MSRPCRCFEVCAKFTIQWKKCSGTCYYLHAFLPHFCWIFLSFRIESVQLLIYGVTAALPGFWGNRAAEAISYAILRDVTHLYCGTHTPSFNYPTSPVRDAFWTSPGNRHRHTTHNTRHVAFATAKKTKIVRFFVFETAPWPIFFKSYANSFCVCSHYVRALIWHQGIDLFHKLWSGNEEKWNTVSMWNI